MGMEEERRFKRQELADYLADLSRQLQGGKLSAGGHTWLVPEEMDAKIHLKQEDGSMVAKIRISWPATEGAQAVRGEPTGLKAVKGRLSTVFKELQRLIVEGVFPDEQTMRVFANEVHFFARYVKPEWQSALNDFLVHVKNLQQAVANRQLESMQQELDALVDGMIVCHREFKK